MDVKSAFLNGVLEEEVYIEQPPRYIKIGEKKKVLKLNKALYRLKQAAQACNTCINRHTLTILLIFLFHHRHTTLRHKLNGYRRLS